MDTYTEVMDVESLAARITDGAKVAVFKENASPMDLTRAMIRRGVRDLHIVTVPTSGLQTELLIAAGCVATVETSGVTLGEFGLAPAFVRAVSNGDITIKDATCPAIYTQIQAGEKGIPFMPMWGLIGSDILANRPDFKVIDNPYEPGTPIVALPAIKPDVTILHAPFADKYGNVWIGQLAELRAMAHASKTCLATVEEIVDFNLLDDEKHAAGTIPSFYVTALAEARNGAWPLAVPGCYDIDGDHIANYRRMAGTQAGISDYLARHVHAVEAAE